MPGPSDAATRTAALWATVVALPVTVLAGLLIFSSVSDRSAAAPRPAPASIAPAAPAAVPSAPVQMAAPRLAARAAAICPEVLTRLPVTVRDLPRRAITAGPQQNAAYGEPAITLECGVPQPEMCPSLTDTRPGCVPLDTELLTMDRVCWYAVPGSATNTLTTMDREVAVRVSVPATYEGAAQWVNEFTAALIAADGDRTSGVPSGCA